MRYIAVVTDMVFGILAIAHGYEVVAIEFDKAFDAVFAWRKGFHNVHDCAPLVGVS